MGLDKEQFYVVDDNVPRHASRSECHSKGLIHRSVHVIVVNDKGGVFLQKRSMKKDLYRDLNACVNISHALTRGMGWGSPLNQQVRR
jgi:isopentenyldiphosphate isomerase